MESFQKPIPVENGEKPQSEAMVDSHKMDERENAPAGRKGANCTNDEAYACFDNTGANRKQASLELPSRKPKQDIQVETLESTSAILKGEKKAEDITIGGCMNPLV